MSRILVVGHVEVYAGQVAASYTLGVSYIICRICGSLHMENSINYIVRCVAPLINRKICENLCKSCH